MSPPVPARAAPRPAPPLAGGGTERLDRRWLALVVMCFTVLLISLDQTVLNVALPTLVRDLRPSSSGLQWIADSYTLTNAVLLMFGGALGDRFGRRRVFIAGASIFGVGSLVCALVHSTGPLIGARAFMGLGAAFLMPSTLSIVTSTFTGHERARAIGIWAGVGGIGSAAGPLLGGWLLQHFWWGSVFLINVPIAVIAIVGGFTVVGESRAEQAPDLDPVGVVLSSLGLTALTYGLITTSTKGWTSGEVLGSFGLAVVLVGGFLYWDGTREHRMLDLHLFTNRTFSSALGAVTAVFFAMFGVSYLLSQFLQFVQGADDLGVGLRFLPLAIGTLISSNVAARLTARFGLRGVMVTGMVLVTGGLAMFTTVSATSTFTPVGIAFSFVGLGMGLVIAPASNAIMSSVPSGKIGSASGIRGTVQLLGGSLGVAVIGSLAFGQYSSQVRQAFGGPLRALPQGARPEVSGQIGQAVAAAAHLPPGLAHTTIEVANRAYVSGIRVSGLVGVSVLVLATLTAVVCIPKRAADPDHDGGLDAPFHL